jgi:hypothetical protein
MQFIRNSSVCIHVCQACLQPQTNYGCIDKISGVAIYHRLVSVFLHVSSGRGCRSNAGTGLGWTPGAVTLSGVITRIGQTMNERRCYLVRDRQE